MIKHASKKRFRESLGASCNSMFSWSWVNHKQKLVYFGASESNEVGSRQLILSLDWVANLKGRKNPNYDEALSHITLIEKEGYKLFTFRQFEKIDNPETGRVKIVNFEQDLEERVLDKRSDGWYALQPGDYDGPANDMADSNQIIYLEGSRVPVSGRRVERNSRARQACIKIHGTACKVCSFDFEKVYGKLGEEFIHVHHKNPIGATAGKYVINPETDLIPLCPNCHSMVHRGNSNRSIEQIKRLIAVRRDS